MSRFNLAAGAAWQWFGQDWHESNFVIIAMFRARRIHLDNEELVKNWQNKILLSCKKRLCRDLTDVEKSFIQSRGGFMALEMIEDTVNTLEADELERYLNSEA